MPFNADIHALLLDMGYGYARINAAEDYDEYFSDEEGIVMVFDSAGGFVDAQYWRADA